PGEHRKVSSSITVDRYTGDRALGIERNEQDEIIDSADVLPDARFDERNLRSVDLRVEEIEAVQETHDLVGRHQPICNFEVRACGLDEGPALGRPTEHIPHC